MNIEKLMPVSFLTKNRAPQDMFDRFKEGDEDVRSAVRQEAMGWLLAQPKDRKVIYIVPHPETGEDLMLQHPGLQ